MVQIHKAKTSDIEKIVSLFNDYRKFYRQDVSPKSFEFLSERIQKEQSVIFYGEEEGIITGFVQLYPSYSSIGLGPIWILNDLYVSPTFRRKKIAWKLIEMAILYAKETNALNLQLSTQISNTNAQELYKKMGFKKDNDFFYFNFKL